jgi:hypothetical protein
VREYAFLLCVFFAIAKPYIRFWLFRPVHERPPFVRHNETLRVIELAAVLALIAGFFFLINSTSFLRSCLVIGGLVAYDVAMRYILMHLEVRRLLATSRRWSYRSASRQVRKRARMPMAT